MFFGPGSGDKAARPSVTDHPASPTAAATDEEEPTGERWDDEEDWGRLEVKFQHFQFNKRV